MNTLKRTQIADKIKDLILTQKVKKGEQISERALASDLGVARGTIRESLVKLADEGLIDSVPGIGAFVKDYSDSEIKDQIYIRSVLEGAAARFAAERINREQARELLSMLEQLKKSFGAKDYELNRQVDMKIHKKIAQISGSQYLESLIIRSLGIRVMTFVDLPHKGHNNATQRHLISFDEHRDIIEAIIDGKAEKAEQLMRLHISKSIDTFLDLIHSTKEHKRI